MHSGIDKRDTKLLGRYYTPISVAQGLTDWAICNPNTRVFDPSFGACAFYEASLRTLSHHGARKAGRRLFGVDIDLGARSYLESTLAAGGEPANFRTTDFLSLKPTDFGGHRFDAIVGNPPYVRHHALSQKPTLHLEIGGSETRVPRSSSYWVYFLLHALRFLAPNGRLAFVLPGSFLYADYSDVVRQALLERFATVYIVIVEERLFPEAEELSIVVLGEGHGGKSSHLRVGYATTLDELGRILKNLGHLTKPVSRDCNPAWNSYLVKPSVSSRLAEFAERKGVGRLGDFANVKIGTVTGCNEFFVLNAEQVKKLDLPIDWLFPILCRTSRASGLRFRNSDYRSIMRAGQPCFLLDVADEDNLGGRISDYILFGETNGIDRRVKCQVRDPWFSFDRIDVPDAFLSSMSFDKVYLIENTMRAASTNNIHGVYWKAGISAQISRSILSLSVSTVFQLSAEIMGRYYGGGLLKIEPSDALNLIAIETTSYSTFKRIDSALRRKSLTEAIRIADRAVAEALHLSDDELDELRESLQKLRCLRVPSRANRHNSSESKPAIIR